MKINNLILLLLVVIFFNCCSSNSKQKTIENTIIGVDSLKVKSNDNCFYFEPYEYVICGIISSRLEYGPPGYGENPNLDQKERIYLITIDSLISICPVDSLDEKIENIKTFQISSSNYNNFDTLIGKRTSLKGWFNNATTGHHYTPALIFLNEKK